MKKRAAIYLAGLLCCLCVYALGDWLSRGESQRLAFPDQGFSLRVPQAWRFQAEEPEAGGQLLGWAGTEDGTAFLCISARQEATGESLSDRTEEELAALVKEWQEAGYEQTGTSRAGRRDVPDLPLSGGGRVSLDHLHDVGGRHAAHVRLQRGRRGRGVSLAVPADHVHVHLAIVEMREVVTAKTPFMSYNGGNMLWTLPIWGG